MQTIENHGTGSLMFTSNTWIMTVIVNGIIKMNQVNTNQCPTMNFQNIAQLQKYQILLYVFHRRLNQVIVINVLIHEKQYHMYLTKMVVDVCIMVHVVQIVLQILCNVGITHSIQLIEYGVPLVILQEDLGKS